MTTNIEAAPGSCRRCDGPLIQQVRTFDAHGQRAVRVDRSAPYCQSCTQQELAAWDREHGQQAQE